MPLQIAFIGANANLTALYFKQMALDNAQQVKTFNSTTRRMTLYDGTEITCIYPGDRAAMLARRFDQIIIADDYRMRVPLCRISDIEELGRRCTSSIVPEEYRYQIYDINAEEPKIL
jgi:hypothetical protein